MEANNDGALSSYYNRPQLNLQTPPLPPAPPSFATATIAAPANGVVPDSTTNNSSSVYTPTAPSAGSSPPENVRKKRGRPRKYDTPEQAAAARKLHASASSAGSKKKREESSEAVAYTSSSLSSKKFQLDASGSTGKGFTLHIITVAVGEDVGQKIMMFMQQSKLEICIISASGLVSNASLRQPATSGGSISYEGRFNILSLSGSYIRAGPGGRTGGLSVCLSSTDGQIIGGGVGGPLTAAGPIQVIVGTFEIETRKDTGGGGKVDAASNKLPSSIGGTSMPDLGIWSHGDSSHQALVGSQFMIQHQGLQLTHSNSIEWRNSTTAHGMQQSSENGDY